MTRTMRMVAALGVVAVCLAAVGTASSVDAKEEAVVGEGIGQLYPDHALPTLASTELTRISSFRGTKVLLVQFASW